MMELIPKAIEQYVSAHSTPEDELRMALINETATGTELPQMQSGQVQGLFLKFMVQALGAKRVLEIGTFTGFSALMMAEGLPEDGCLITCDVDEHATNIAKRFWAKHPDGSKIELKLGPALETIAQIDEQLDFVFIDADKINYTNYWEAVLPKVRQGGFVAVDNVLWDGRVLDPKEPDDLAIAAFNKHAVQDPRVEVAMITIRDGVTLARVK